MRALGRVWLGTASCLFGTVSTLLFVPGPCTTFDGAGVGANGGDGGPPSDEGSPLSDARAQPDGAYLTLNAALNVCSKVMACMHDGALPTSIQASLGVPLGNFVGGANFGACVQWLAGTLVPTPTGFAEQQGVLACVAAASSCRAAATCLPELASRGTPSDIYCPDSAYCDGNDYCNGLGRQQCSHPAFGDAAVCDPTLGCVVPVFCPGTCDDGVAHICVDGGTILDTCSLRGAACATTTSRCSGVGGCNNPYSPTCQQDAAVAVGCSWPGKTGLTFPCAPGAMCASNSSNIVCSVPDAGCTPFGAHCVGASDSIQLCVDGQQQVGACDQIVDGGHCGILPGNGNPEGCVVTW